MWNIQSSKTLKRCFSWWPDFNRIVKITCIHRKENRVYHKSLTHNHESQWWMTPSVFDQWWFLFISRIFPLGKTNDKIMFDPASWDWYSKIFPKWLCVLFTVFSRKDGLIMQNHLFENDSFSLSSLGPPIIMSHLLEVLACSSLYIMIHRDNDSIFHPLRAWINPFVIVFNLRNALYILSRKCWIPKTKNFRILNKKKPKYFKYVFQWRLWIWRFGKSNVTNTT